MKDRYNQELTTYKMTDEYRNYMDYLADFKLKKSNSAGVCRDHQETRTAERTTEGKRPRLEHEESTGSSATMQSGGADGPESIQGSHGLNRQRLDALNSTGPFVGSAMPSSATAAASAIRAGTGTATSVHNISPNSSISPSSPSVRRESSGNSLPASSLQSRAPVEPNFDPGSSASSRRQIADASFPRSTSSGSPSIEVRPNRGQESPAGPRQPSRRTPALLHQTTSSSSGLSIGSQLSSVSTAPSSIYAPRNGEEDVRDVRPQLPPLSATGLGPSAPPGLAEYSLRKSQTPESSTPTSLSQQHLSTPTPTPTQTHYQPPPLSSGTSLSVSYRSIHWYNLWMSATADK